MCESGERPSAELTLQWLPGRYAIARLDADAAVPRWAAGSAPLLSITRTIEELSILAPQQVIPDNVRAERDFVAMRVVGTLAFNLVGIIAKLTGALAGAGIPVFVVSTYDTDYLLLRAEDQERARRAIATVAHVKF